MNAGKIGKLSAENLLSMDNAEKSRKERSGLWQALGLAWNLGYIIALPLVVFALGGRLLDRRMGTSPLFLLAGIFISLVVTTVGLMRKINVMTKEMSGSENSNVPQSGTNDKEKRNSAGQL